MESQSLQLNCEIDCKYKGYEGLVGATFSRYKILKSLSKGANGLIYMIEDANEENANLRLQALKIQEDRLMANREINAMKKFKQVFEANKQTLFSQKINYDPLPVVHDYGVITLLNFD